MIFSLIFIFPQPHGCHFEYVAGSNDVFENACMEFDEVNLKPTFRILWGVPGSILFIS